jgi:hypothetical protein
MFFGSSHNGRLLPEFFFRFLYLGGGHLQMDLKVWKHAVGAGELLITVGRLYNVIMSSEESSESTWRVLEEKYVVIPTHIKICFQVLLVTLEFVSLQKLTNQP